MKGINGNPALDAYQRVSSISEARSARPVAPRAEEGGQAEPAARVSISSDARRLSTAGHASSEEKVAELRAAIQAGSYQVDAEAVARRLIDVLA